MRKYLLMIGIGDEQYIITFRAKDGVEAQEKAIEEATQWDRTVAIQIYEIKKQSFEKGGMWLQIPLLTTTIVREKQ